MKEKKFVDSWTEIYKCPEKWREVKEAAMKSHALNIGVWLLYSYPPIKSITKIEHWENKDLQSTSCPSRKHEFVTMIKFK